MFKWFFDETTFFHELTHLFSYNCSKFDFPPEYYNFREDFLSSRENTSLIISFLDLCNKKKENLVNRAEEEKSLNDFEKILDNTESAESDDVVQYSIITKIEDIIDCI